PPALIERSAAAVALSLTTATPTEAPMPTLAPRVSPSAVGGVVLLCAADTRTAPVARSRDARVARRAGGAVVTRAAPSPPARPRLLRAAPLTAPVVTVWIPVALTVTLPAWTRPAESWASASAVFVGSTFRATEAPTPSVPPLAGSAASAVDVLVEAFVA